MRKRIYQIIQKASKGDKWSYVYDIFMLAIILASIIPLTVIGEKPYFTIIEIITTSVFIIDYILRWATADYKLNKGTLSFVLYPFTPMAIVDLLSILPGFGVINQGFKIFRITRMLKILRIFKFLRYSDKISLFVRVLHKEKNVLLSVLGIAIFYVFLTALIMFNVEPHVNPITGAQTFSNFFDALYWATVTLTTVGYGDLCPVTDVGRCVSMLSSLFGVAIIALPSGVITASYLDELRKPTKNED
jgi:voltage-gated potassium channel